MNTRQAITAPLALCLAGLISGPALAPGQDLPVPGSEAEVDIGGAYPAVCFVPRGYDAEKAWPVILWYHGKNGRPGTQPVRSLCREQHFVILGMSYAFPEGSDQVDPDREAAVFEQGLRWLQQQVRVDPRRIYLGGISKGGWQAVQLGDRYAQKLAGLVVLLAGRPPRSPNPPRAWQGKPIYLGTGEADPNLPFAQRGANAYRRQGAHTTLEEFPGVGHAVPASAPRLQTWLDVEGRLRPQGGAAPEELVPWFTGTWAEAEAETGSSEKAAAFRALSEDPRMALVSAVGRQRVAARLKALRTDPEVKSAWQAEQTYLQLGDQEDAIRTLEDMKQVRDGFRHLIATWPDTVWARQAEKHLLAVETAYQKSVEATARANADRPPTGTLQPDFSGLGGLGGQPTAPRIRRDGNRIRFER